jgi:hypothetical protein
MWQENSVPDKFIDMHIIFFGQFIGPIPVRQKIQQMITFEQGLVTSGKLNYGQVNSLIVKLNATTRNVDYGNSNAAINELNAFINEVNADIKTGKLSSKDRQTLIDGTKV